ncbi:unnamed protein product, partial [Tenebrio molitor]
ARKSTGGKASETTGTKAARKSAPATGGVKPTVTDLVPWLCVRSVVTRKVPELLIRKPLSTFGEGDRSDFKTDLRSKLRRDGPPGSERNLLGRSVRGHEFVCHPRQT